MPIWQLYADNFEATRHQISFSQDKTPYVTTCIVAADDLAFTRVYILDHQGEIPEDTGYPKIAMDYYQHICPPLITEIDGDGQKKVIVAIGGEPVIAWEADGLVTPGFLMLDLALDYEVTPAIENLYQDGDLEFMVVGDEYRFHVLDLPTLYEPGLIDWGMVSHDAQNSRWTLPTPLLNPMAGATSYSRPMNEKLEIIDSCQPSLNRHRK